MYWWIIDQLVIRLWRIHICIFVFPFYFQRLLKKRSVLWLKYPAVINNEESTHSHFYYHIILSKVYPDVEQQIKNTNCYKRC